MILACWFSSHISSISETGDDFGKKLGRSNVVARRSLQTRVLILLGFLSREAMDWRNALA